MPLPFFYEEIIPDADQFSLSEESSRHIVQVLRMKERETVQITNGQGRLVTAEILEAHKRNALVQVLKTDFTERIKPPLAIAISLIKNTNRMEWFIEKATEIGLSEIFFLICRHTEKSRVREDRMKGIMVSAMLQSRQVWLPELSSQMNFNEFLEYSNNYNQKFIAHCYEADKVALSSACGNSRASKVVAIGPEGDFSPQEVADALKVNFMPVTLGTNRLRTETAALAAAVMLNMSY